MNVDPVNEKKESRSRGLAGFSYVLISVSGCEWHRTCRQRPYCGSEDDSIRLKTNSPKGKRYAY